MFIPLVHATFYRNEKHSFRVILEITNYVYTIDQKKQLLFYDTGTRPEKVLTKNILWVRKLEDRILCPRTMATYAFSAITFFSDNFFQKNFTAQRGGLRS